MRQCILFLIMTIALSVCLSFTWRWGFFAHRKINRIAVFTLPKEMLGFYKSNIGYITENAINPDKRRYAVEGEAPRHYIDIDMYGDSALFQMPRLWSGAVAKYSEDTLMAYGIVPWHIHRVKGWLTDAMQVGDPEAILRLSADLGHYISDANVPLHTTENYNGQLTDQYGIHGFWESRLPELFTGSYDLMVGKAGYIENTQLAAWEAVECAHMALDSVLLFEKELSRKFPEDKKYAYSERGASHVKAYSTEYAEAYQQQLHGMVERQMRRSIKMVGDFWYTCWIDAGQPALDTLRTYQPTAEELEMRRKKLAEWKEERYKARTHEH